MSLHPEFPYPVYLVLSESACRHHSWLDVARCALQGGVDIIQLREKTLSTAELLHRAARLKELTDDFGVPLIVNDFPEVAAEVEAWGVHVGRSDIPPSAINSQFGHRLKIGWSLEVITQFQDPEMQYVHHLGVSPIYSTPTKTDTITEWGLQGLRKVRDMTGYPLIAIGGINEQNAKAIFEAGAHSIAVVSAVCGSLNPRQAAEKLKRCWKTTCNHE